MALALGLAIVNFQHWTHIAASPHRSSAGRVWINAEWDYATISNRPRARHAEDQLMQPRHGRSSRSRCRSDDRPAPPVSQSKFALRVRCELFRSTQIGYSSASGHALLPFEISTATSIACAPTS